MSGNAMDEAPFQAFPDGTCARASHVASLLPVPADTQEDRSSSLPLPSVSPFSRTAVDTASVIGVLPELMVIANARDDSLPFERLLTARQNLVERVTLTMLEVASVTGEIDCENERSGQLRNQLQKAEEQRLRSFTVAGLVLGAATAIISGGIALHSPEAASANIVNVLGGSAQAGTGYATLSYTPTGLLRHERNLLTDLWNGENGSAAYPASIWRFLNHSRGGNVDTPLSRLLVAQWKADGRLGTQDSDEERRRAGLIFGRGGKYTIEDLQARDAILDQLEATVKLLYQDLALLLRELSAWSAANRR
ncbi:hypothetical protein ABC383_23590 [Noviherbaspirillum sp. 1P10PC]|uniref:hypothetical protein n=1 Tax=Noviherbaspirillum sp. 1P10PC TaxID=3132292 RepID=UPI00399F7C3F